MGIQCVSASATPLEEEVYAHVGVRCEDFPPREMLVKGIERTIADYTKCVIAAVEEVEFDGGRTWREWVLFVTPALISVLQGRRRFLVLVGGMIGIHGECWRVERMMSWCFGDSFW
jgi:hypothetical protein